VNRRLGHGTALAQTQYKIYLIPGVSKNSYLMLVQLYFTCSVEVDEILYIEQPEVILAESC